MVLQKETTDGGDIMLFMTGKSIAGGTSHKLTISAETTETAPSKDSKGGWSKKAIKKMSWNASCDNLYTEDYDTVYKAMIAKEPVDLVFGPKKETVNDVADTSTGYWTPATTGVRSGKGLITSIETNAGNDGEATYSVSFEGTGELK